MTPISTLAHKARLLAAALDQLAQDKYQTKTDKECWNQYGADINFPTARVIEADEYIAFHSPEDGRFEIWPSDFSGAEPFAINTRTGDVSF